MKFTSIISLALVLIASSAPAQSIATSAPNMGQAVEIEKPREYKMSEMTRSIAFGTACEAADNGDSTKSISAKVLDMVLARETKLSRKDARVLINVLVRSAIDKCGSLGSN
ncbi:hypothetical protein [Chamaesiphon sp.]|uniref:hypothetical protein n=1 Tax=Chamaesiphon sp. TaxID=2814140 RepID=UPI0035930ECE